MTIRVGCIGGGLAVFDLHVPALRQLEDVDISRIATSSPASAKAASTRLAEVGFASAIPCSAGELLDASDVDVVLVAVPIAATAELVRGSLAAGKPVLAEKPVAETSAEGTELLRMAQSTEVPMLAGENFRLQPDFRRVRELVDDGAIGDARLYFLNDLHFTGADGKYAQTPWRIKGQHAGGYLIDGGTHIVAGMREMVGRDIRSVHALASTVREYLGGQSDTLLLNIEFAGGFVGHLALGYGVFDFESRHPKVYGTRGTLALMPDGIVRVDESGQEVLAARSQIQGFVEEWRMLLDAVESKRPEAVWRLTEESILDLRLLELGMQSAAMRRAVEF